MVRRDKVADVFLFMFAMVFCGAAHTQTKAEAVFLDIPGHEVSFEASYGLLAIEGEEIVFRDDKTNNKLSQLLFNSQLSCFNLGLRYNWLRPAGRAGFYLNGGVKFAFSSKAGELTDSDWTYLYYPEALSHYSVHKTKDDEGFIGEAELGLLCRVFNTFLIKLGLSYNYMEFNWEAFNGAFLYPTEHGGHDLLSDEYDIKVITYRQIWHIIAPAFSFSGPISRYVSFDIGVKASPVIFFSGEDNHLLRELVITGDFFGGLFVESTVVVSLMVKPFKISAFSTVQYISKTRGDGYYKGDIEGNGNIAAFTNDNGNGAGFFSLAAGVLLTLNIF
ncbi:MAG: omptin family outer membrane protease [Spirochaetaceae bacterium]|jgi:outer membrane protease|nr:omptin family outer membrane protease [Spirochaetaceae bacterium]